MLVSKISTTNFFPCVQISKKPYQIILFEYVNYPTFNLGLLLWNVWQPLLTPKWPYNEVAMAMTAARVILYIFEYILTRHASWTLNSPGYLRSRTNTLEADKSRRLIESQSLLNVMMLNIVWLSQHLMPSSAIVVCSFYSNFANKRIFLRFFWVYSVFVSFFKNMKAKWG